MDYDEQPPEEDPPFDAAIFACIVSFVLIHWTALCMAPWIQVWWTELLVNPLIPMMLIFIILYRSRCRREVIGITRILSLLLLSVIIFAGTIIFFGVLFTLVCAVCSGFTNWHY